MRKLQSIFALFLFLGACAPELDTVLPDEPAVPEGVISVVCEGDTALRFEWQAVEGAAEYSYVLRDRENNLVDAGKTTGLYMDFCDLNVGYAYTFAVKAVNSAAESAFSAFVQGICGGELREPYGSFGLELYSLDGDIQIDTLTVLASSTDGVEYSTGFKNVALNSEPQRFPLRYLTEGQYSDIRYKIRYSRTSEEETVTEEYEMDVTSSISVVCDTIIAYSAPVLALDQDDLYSVWLHGEDITIAGQTVNRGMYPKAQLKTMSEITWNYLASAFDHAENGGILFIENSSKAHKATAANRTIGKDRIIIGRYRNEHQPIFRINGDKAYMWTFEGSVMMKNITLSSFRTSRPLFAGKDGGTHGASQFYFDDCTLTNTATNYGIFSENTATWAVPSSMRFDNCILRSNAEFFSAAGKGTGSTTAESASMVSMQNLKSLVFNNCVFAPATVADADNTNGEFISSKTVSRMAKNGALVALYNINHYFDDLDITCCDCTFYDMGASNANRGVIDVTTVGDVKIERSVFYNSAIAQKTLLCNAVKMCPSASLKVVSSFYQNPSVSQGMAGGSATNLKGSPADATRYSVSFNAKSGMFADPQPQNHYFPRSLDFTDAGATYDTKYWIVPTPEQQPEDQPSEENPQL